MSKDQTVNPDDAMNPDGTTNWDVVDKLVDLPTERDMELMAFESQAERHFHLRQKRANILLDALDVIHGKGRPITHSVEEILGVFVVWALENGVEPKDFKGIALNTCYFVDAYNDPKLKDEVITDVSEGRGSSPFITDEHRKRGNQFLNKNVDDVIRPVIPGHTKYLTDEERFERFTREYPDPDDTTPDEPA